VWKIPKEDQLGLGILAKMPEDVFHSFLAEINRSPLGAPTIGGLAVEDVQRTWSTIKVMHRVRHSFEVEIDEFIADISKSLQADKTLEKSDESLFRKRLHEILNIESLSIAAKAVAIGQEYENVFCNARIFTDLRPVFGTNVSDQLETMVINHQLKIEYHKAPKGRHEIYLSLSSDELKDLRALLDREDQKIGTLKASLANSKLKFVDSKHKPE